MHERHPHQDFLLKCISSEMDEQEKRYQLESSSGLKQLKANSLALHPIRVSRKSFGYADYPEISFTTAFHTDISNFKDNVAIECFLEGESSVKGILLGMDGNKGQFRLFAPDFPDWIEEHGVGIKLAPDHHTSNLMRDAIKDLDTPSPTRQLFNRIHGTDSFGELPQKSTETISFSNERLNQSQKNAVQSMLYNEGLTIVHGPPGTGKTTTIVEGILQLIKLGKSVLVSAPSNAAVDTIAKKLVSVNAKILRVGNSLKVDEDIYPYTPEGKMRNAKENKEIKRLKIQSEEYRKMALQYKRRFGKEERQQRSLLMNEVKQIRKQIKEIRSYFDEKIVEEADIVLGTPVGLRNFLDEDSTYDVLIIDEAGQALEPLAWLIFPFAEQWVLAGDHHQLPPTVISEEAKTNGFDQPILERAFKNCNALQFLNIQYRMRASIASFSSAYFYEGKLSSAENLADKTQHLTFFDTAGTGYEEEAGKDGVSLMNQGEIECVQQLIEHENISLSTAAFISPYSGQVLLAKELLPNGLRISTIDSFQGQEHDVIILSLVRSNLDGDIGFLKDYRRMNVAMTRAKEHLYVISDSSTIGQDAFYTSFLDYIEKVNGYRSAWELMS